MVVLWWFGRGSGETVSAFADYLAARVAAFAGNAAGLRGMFGFVRRRG